MGGEDHYIPNYNTTDMILFNLLRLFVVVVWFVFSPFVRFGFVFVFALVSFCLPYFKCIYFNCGFCDVCYLFVFCLNCLCPFRLVSFVFCFMCFF